MSAFQKAIRGDCTVLHDHICKEMNELNLERCRCIPKNTPGADWRVLQEIVAANPERATFKVWSAVRMLNSGAVEISVAIMYGIPILVYWRCTSICAGE